MALNWLIEKNVEELCCFLQEELDGIDEVLENVRKHKINGEAFLQLNEEYLREVAPLLGDRIKLKGLLSKISEPTSLASTPTPESSAVDDGGSTGSICSGGDTSVSYVYMDAIM
jgi:hypothetical protein